MEKEVFVERYIKRKGGKYYCSVHYSVGSKNVVVGEFATEDKEKAKDLAKATIEKLMKMLQ